VFYISSILVRVNHGYSITEGRELQTAKYSVPVCFRSLAAGNQVPIQGERKCLMFKTAQEKIQDIITRNFNEVVRWIHDTKPDAIRQWGFRSEGDGTFVRYKSVEGRWLRIRVVHQWSNYRFSLVSITLYEVAQEGYKPLSSETAAADHDCPAEYILARIEDNDWNDPDAVFFDAVSRVMEPFITEEPIVFTANDLVLAV
jgi:hypothetical protein